MAAYGSDIDFAAWLAAQGLSLPVGAPAPAILRAIGSAYVDGAYEPRLFCSERMDPFTQELAWPRRNAFLQGKPIPDDLIPIPWINASYRAAYLTAVTPGWAQSGLDPSRMTKREKAGEVEREFFGAGEGGLIGNAAQGFRVDPLIDGMVSLWLCDPVTEGGMQFLMSIGS
jgi:hypothetical protein